MVLTKQQKQDFEKAARVMMKYLGENHQVIIDNGKAEILEGSGTVVTDDYIAD